VGDIFEDRLIPDTDKVGTVVTGAVSVRGQLCVVCAWYIRKTPSTHCIIQLISQLIASHSTN